MCALKDFLWQWTRDDAGLRAPRGDVGRVVGKGFEGGERERERGPTATAGGSAVVVGLIEKKRGSGSREGCRCMWEDHVINV